MHNFELDMFKDIISNISSNCNSFDSPTIDNEDVYQRLYMKLLRVFKEKMDAIVEECNEFNDEQKREYIRNFIIQTLSNEKRDIIRYLKRRPDLSKYSNESSIGEDFSLDSILVNQISLFDNVVNRFDNPEDILFNNDLIKIINNWSVNESEDTRNFIREVINPSPQTEEIWEDMVSSYDRYKHYQYIPPYTLGKILNIPNHVVTSILSRLKSFLKENGYCLK